MFIYYDFKFNPHPLVYQSGEVPSVLGIMMSLSNCDMGNMGNMVSSAKCYGFSRLGVKSWTPETFASPIGVRLLHGTLHNCFML